MGWLSSGLERLWAMGHDCANLWRLRQVISGAEMLRLRKESGEFIDALPLCSYLKFRSAGNGGRWLANIVRRPPQ